MPKLTGGQSSYYQVKAVDKAGNESDYAAKNARRPAAGEAPDVPRNLTAEASQKGIFLDWTDNNENDLAGYNVYRKVVGTDEFAKLTDGLLEESEYLDAEAPFGKTSRYRVTAVDNGGDESNPATIGREMPEEDAAAPDTGITGGPKGHVKSRDASFSFKSSEEGSTFECKLDGGSFENCSSPEEYTGLKDGKHVFQVRATDEVGNTDGSAAKRTWTVDTNGPRIYKISPRFGTRDRTPTVRATVRDAQANLSKSDIKLYFDGRRKEDFSYNRRTDRLSYTTGKLAKKRHTVKIVAIDKAGNKKVRTWRFRVR